MSLPPGIAKLIVVNNFCFCQVHGEEFCYRCTYDFRWQNNQNVVEKLDEEGSEELSDDRESINVYTLGAVKSNTKDADGDPQYKCKQHGTVDCGTCFDWVKVVLGEIHEKRNTEKWLEKRKKWLDKVDP